ncbi:MAG: polymer-forming cytoskeletal protein [Ruminococcus sp.]|nr:polymer-forming cytoskeletal protein [Ruminococcus sp.]
MMSKNKNTTVDTKARIGTIIGKGAVFNGNLSDPQSVRLDGTLNGNCECKGMTIVGVDGQINGDIITQNMVVAGKIEGDIIAEGKLELLSTAKMTGNITAKSLVIDENACFDGRCSMTSPDAASAKDNRNNKNETTAESGKENQNTTAAESDQKNRSRY